MKNSDIISIGVLIILVLGIIIVAVYLISQKNQKVIQPIIYKESNRRRSIIVKDDRPVYQVMHFPGLTPKAHKHHSKLGKDCGSLGPNFKKDKDGNCVLKHLIPLENQ